MESLYEIKEEYLNAMNNLEVDENGEIVNYDAIEAIIGKFDDKAEAVACYILNEEALADAIKLKEKAFKERREAHERRAESLTKYLADMMEAVGKDKFETSNCKASFRKSNAVEVTDETLIPDFYINTVVERKPDKKAITEAFKAGTEVPGCEYVTRRKLNVK